MSKGMVTCKICGRDFALIKEDHYIADNGEKEGVITKLVSSDRTTQYDAFDCPHCGCQNIMQIRKPLWVPDELMKNEVPEHDGCQGCKNESLGEDDYPCIACKHRYTDKWEAKDEVTEV